MIIRTGHALSGIREPIQSYMQSHFAPHHPPQRRYVLALAGDADVVERAEGVDVIQRLPSAVLVATDIDGVSTLAQAAEHVLVYRHESHALIALSYFDH